MAEQEVPGAGSSLASINLPLGDNHTPNEWADACHDAVQHTVELQTIKKMNSIRVSTWRLMAEKARNRYLADGLRCPSLPVELCGRIADFLGVLDEPFAVRKFAAAINAELVEKSCGWRFMRGHASRSAGRSTIMHYRNFEEIFDTANLKDTFGCDLETFRRCFGGESPGDGKWWRSAVFHAQLERFGLEAKPFFKKEGEEDKELHRREAQGTKEDVIVMKLRYFPKEGEDDSPEDQGWESDSENQDAE